MQTDRLIFKRQTEGNLEMAYYLQSRNCSKPWQLSTPLLLPLWHKGVRNKVEGCGDK